MFPFMMPVVLHHQESHIVPHFDHLDLWNAMMPLTMLSASIVLIPVPLALCDADASGIT